MENGLSGSEKRESGLVCPLQSRNDVRCRYAGNIGNYSREMERNYCKDYKGQM